MTLRRAADIILISGAAILTGCGTGIDSTGPVTRAETARQAAEPTAEELYLAGIAPQPLGQWKPGKQFYVTDDRLRLTLEQPAPESGHLAGDTLSFSRCEERIDPTGAPTTRLVFNTTGGREAVYTVRLDSARLAQLDKVEIPFAIELSVVEAARSRLLGRRFWVLTPERYTTDGSTLHGRKFIPVTVSQVSPGNSVYDLALTLDEDDDGTSRSMVYITTAPKAASHRGFAAVFSLTDPRQRYSDIDNTVWQAICANQVAAGMTRQECRLAWGAPASADRRPTGGGYITEVWSYDNGSYLIFEDGILSDFRR